MNMQKIILLIFVLVQLSCIKQDTDISQTQPLENIRFKLYDSVIRIYDNMNGNTIIQENHNALNRVIEIDKIITSGELIYNSDTFKIYTTSPLVFSSINSSFPLLRLDNDSISIYKHIGGVGYQTWEYLLGYKY